MRNKKQALRNFDLILSNWFGLMKFCEEVNLQIVPAIDITNDVAELIDVISQIKEYLDLFNDFKYVLFCCLLCLYLYTDTYDHILDS